MFLLKSFSLCCHDCYNNLCPGRPTHDLESWLCFLAFSFSCILRQHLTITSHLRSFNLLPLPLLHRKLLLLWSLSNTMTFSVHKFVLTDWKPNFFSPSKDFECKCCQLWYRNFSPWYSTIQPYTAPCTMSSFFIYRLFPFLKKWSYF